MSDKTQGYITLASSADITALMEASLLGRSIKVYDPDREVCLVTDDYSILPETVEDNFDYVIELPFGALPDEDFDVNIWQVYYCTPFDRNIFLNKQSILTNNIDGIWEKLIHDDICLPSQTKNFKNNTHDFLYYFKCHEKNLLDSYFSDIFYFQKSETASEFFKILDPVLQNWRSVYINFIKENKPDKFNMNLCFNIATKMIGLDMGKDNFTYTYLSLENVELDDTDLPDDWTQYVSCWVKDQKIKVSNFQLTDIIFYNSSTFIDQEMLDDFRITN
jgi:hypothetical protein